MLTGLLTVALYLLYSSFFSSGHIAKIINDNKEHYSIILSQDDTILININAEVSRPLASVVKLIVAIEFSEQVGAGQLDKEEMVPVGVLEKYHLQHTDGQAHEDWILYLNAYEKMTSDSMISLWEVARGMMTYSSNANAEYLMDRLGIDNVNNRLEQLGIEKHSRINYPVSYLYLTPTDLKTETDKGIYSKCQRIHEQLKADGVSVGSFDYGIAMSPDNQKLLSDRMSSSTALEYYELLRKISSNGYFSHKVQMELNSIIERDVPAGKYDIVRYGGKGGSTLWILNNAVYLERKNGKQYKFIMFSNYPTDRNDNMLLSKVMSKLIVEITDDTEKAEELISIINK